jgi:hypothetical protein
MKISNKFFKLLSRFFFTNMRICTVRKAKRDAGPEHVGDVKFRHRHTVDLDDRSTVH